MNVADPIAAVTDPDPYPYYRQLAATRPFHPRCRAGPVGGRQRRRGGRGARPSRLPGPPDGPAGAARAGRHPGGRPVRPAGAHDRRGAPCGAQGCGHAGDGRHRPAGRPHPGPRTGRAPAARGVGRRPRGQSLDVHAAPCSAWRTCSGCRWSGTKPAMRVHAGGRLRGDVRGGHVAAGPARRCGGGRRGRAMVDALGGGSMPRRVGLLAAMVQATRRGRHRPRHAAGQRHRPDDPGVRGHGRAGWEYAGAAGAIGKGRTIWTGWSRIASRTDPPVQNTRRFPGGRRPAVRRGPEGGRRRAGAAGCRIAHDPFAHRPDRSWTFGTGRRGCPGDALARLLAAVTVDSLLQRDVDPRRLLRGLRYRPSVNARIPLFTPSHY